MRIATFIFCLFLTSISSAAGFNHLGSYSGVGYFKEPSGRTGSYEIKAEFSERNVRGQNVIALTTNSKLDGRTFTWTIYLANERNGFFTILDANTFSPLGEGFCFESQCQLSSGSLTTQVIETLTFQNTTLTVLGVRIAGGQRFVYQETLIRR